MRPEPSAMCQLGDDPCGRDLGSGVRRCQALAQVLAWLAELDTLHPDISEVELHPNEVV